MALLSVRDLRTSFHTRNGVVRAVDGISFDVDRNQTLGIVGESGSGKSVTCYSLLDLIPKPPGRIESGTAHFDGVDLLQCDSTQMREFRGKRISMIFQDPMTCLNPYMRVGDQLMEPLLIHEGLSKEQARARVISALEDVGMPYPKRRIKQFPHEFSGGMRQRVMIAMALITKPELLIADEPTTALDVTVQAQILELIKKMQKEIGMAVIFITHDLGVIAGVADQIMVLYAGRVAETGNASEVFYQSCHPYTRALLESIPSRQVLSGRSKEELYTIPGLPPDLTKPLTGCAFAERCPSVQDHCAKTEQGIAPVPGGGKTQQSSCVRVLEGSLS